MDLREKEKEAVDREKQEGREDRAWPVDSIKLRPSSCVATLVISVSRLGLISGSLAGQLLLSISKFLHLHLAAEEKAQNRYVIAQVELKALTTCIWSL